MRKFVFGYLGMPSDTFDEVYKKRNILGQNVKFEGFPLKIYEETLELHHGIRMLKKFIELRKADSHDEAMETGYAVIYIKPPNSNLENFESLFFPSTLIYPIEWTRQYGSKKKIAEANNELFRKLEKATKESIKILEAFRKETVEKANRTPFLLPLKNFRSKALIESLEQLQANWLTETDPNEVIKQASSEFERQHPPQRVDYKDKAFYMNPGKIEFHSPGKALHGILGSQAGHTIECIMNGMKRLGAPYHPAFHYDCQKGERGNLKGLFFNCHEDEEKMEGDPHINVAPNDFVRI